MRLLSYFDLFEVPVRLSSSSGTKFPMFFKDRSCNLPQGHQLYIELLQPEKINLSLEIYELSSPQICCSLMGQLLQISIFLELPSIKNTGKCLWKILEPPDSFAPSIPNKGSAWEGIVTGIRTAGFQWWPCFRTTWLGWTFPEMRANVEIHAILPQISFTFSFRLQEQDWNSVRTFCSI